MRGMKSTCQGESCLIWHTYNHVDRGTGARVIITAMGVIDIRRLAEAHILYVPIYQQYIYKLEANTDQFMHA